jgi:hypothetical protein
MKNINFSPITPVYILAYLLIARFDVTEQR